MNKDKVIDNLACGSWWIMWQMIFSILAYGMFRIYFTDFDPLIGGLAGGIMWSALMNIWIMSDVGFYDDVNSMSYSGTENTEDTTDV